MRVLQRGAAPSILEVVVGASNAGRFRQSRATRLACCICGYLSACRRSPHFHSRVSRRRTRGRGSIVRRVPARPPRGVAWCAAARVWSRPRAETPEMSTLALSAAASGRAHAQLSASVSRAHASRAASIAPTACHARSVSAVLASHRRLGDAAARSRVASWATSHRRKSATSASASTADGSSSRDARPIPTTVATRTRCTRSKMTQKTIRTRRSWLLGARLCRRWSRTNAPRRTASRVRKAGGGRTRNDENERCVRGRLSLSSVSSRFLLPRDRRRRVEHHPRCSLFLVIHQYWHQPDRLVPWGTPRDEKTVPLGWRRASI